jgi:Leucine-rich repeat (LRR) protein
MFLVDNKLKYLPFTHEEFPNLEWIRLDVNPISNLERLVKFTNLKKLMMTGCQLNEALAQ